LLDSMILKRPEKYNNTEEWLLNTHSFKRGVRECTLSDLLLICKYDRHTNNILSYIIFFFQKIFINNTNIFLTMFTW
jgi:hypothetical protein